MTQLLPSDSFECRVSSVLNRNVKSFGKKYMFDDNEETCWNSESGVPQWITIEFKKECDLAAIEITFQGGFVGKECYLEAGADSKSLKRIQQLFPEDTNSLQRFTMNQTTKGKMFRLMFEQSTDFFGRIIIYRLSFYS